MIPRPTPEAAAQSARRVAIVLALAAAAVLTSVWPSLVLAAWIADLTHPLAQRLQRALGGRRRAAGMITVLVVLVALVPLAGASVTLAHGARDLISRFGGELARGGPLANVLDVSEGVRAFAVEPRTLVEFLEKHGASVWKVGASIATASAGVFFGAIVFVTALYAFSVDGRALFLWFARRRIVDLRATGRLLGAFRETGRGLFVGMGGTALAQGTVAAISYAALGVNDALTLGLLTGVCSFVPAIGTMLVWGPVAAGLALGGHPVRAVVLVALGLGVIGMADNVLRPWLARAGRLKLPTVVVFVSMIAGLRLLGAKGVLLGPLIVRLAVEGLAIARDARASRRGVPSEADQDPTGPRVLRIAQRP
jgi:predicted PurR-regulated permease PerM